MNSSEYEGHFWRLATPEMSDLERELRQSLGSAVGQLNAHGQLRSGRATLVLTEIARVNLRQRLQKAWYVLQRVLSDIGVTPDAETTNALKIIFGRLISQQCERVHTDLEQFKPKDLLRNGGTELEQEAIAQRARIEAEIELLMEKLRRQRAPVSGQPVFNFLGPVGAVQTGSGAVAHVRQGVSPSELARIAAALDELTAAVQKATELGAEQRLDLVAVLSEVSAEVHKPRPNATKLTGLAYGLAATVQTAASVVPAYNAVKSALAAVGIVLP